eukprot:15464215-Alexandrium_andersonii.AAC.1
MADRLEVPNGLHGRVPEPIQVTEDRHEAAEQLLRATKVPWYLGAGLDGPPPHNQVILPDEAHGLIATLF